MDNLSMDLVARTALRRPKRLLSLDGGGIRGVLAAEILVSIEEMLKRRLPSLTCLADYFDFVGGTSTGSILASGIALGIPATTLRDFYIERGPRLFRKTLLKRLWHKYESAPLAAELRSIFGDRTLGSPDLRTLLLVVAKNITAGETWFFTNNPNGKNVARDSARRLVDLILASSAAPTYFPPVTLDAGDGTAPGDEFVDGGMSMFNNPSLQLFLEATEPVFGLGWPRGEEKILLVSVGTGYHSPRLRRGAAAGTSLLGWAGHAIDTLMEDANVQQNALLRTLGTSRRPRFSDEELAAQGASSDVLLPRGPALLRYHRYTTSLTKERLHDDLGLPRSIDPESLFSLDAVDRVRDLAAVGRAVAVEQVSDADFEGFLDDAEPPMAPLGSMADR